MTEMEIGSTTLQQGSKEWKRMRHRCMTDLYYLNYVVLGLGPLIPMTPRAHAPMCLFASRQTGIPEVDNCRVQLIHVERGRGKSACITNGRSTQRLLINRDYAIGIANEKAGKAADFLSNIKVNFQYNDLLKFLFPEHIPDFRKTTWKSDAIVLNRTTRSNTVNPSVLAAGTETAVTGVHMNEWICDDLISDEAYENARAGLWTQMEKAFRWIDRLQYLLTNFRKDPITFIGCIAENSPILMADGTWKAIQDIEVGDEVWACKKEGSRDLGPKKVTGVWPQGYSDVIEVRAAGGRLVCTPDHPILAAAGRSDGVGRRWEEASELTNKVEVFEGMPGVDHGYDLDFMYLLGFLWGDGWVTRYDRKQGWSSYAVCFALGEDEALNEYIESLFEEFFSRKPTRGKDRCARLDSAETGRRLEKLGLTAGVRATEKELPEWLFKIGAEEKRAFLRGLCNADGSQTSPTRWAIELNNKKMVEQIHQLATTCYVRPSTVYSRTRTSQPPNSPKPITTTSYHVALNFLDRVDSSHKYKPTITTLNTQVPVYDLTVENGDCAYIAGNLYASNTPWWPGDIYDYIQEKWGHGEDTKKYEWVCHLPDGDFEELLLEVKGEIAIFKHPPLKRGRAVYPEKLTLEQMEIMQKEDPQLHAAQILLIPTAGGVASFKPEWLRTFEWEGQRQIHYRDDNNQLHFARTIDMNIIMSVDPAISEKSSAARSAVTVTASSGSHIFQLESWAKRASPTELTAKILEFFKEYKPSRLIIEKVGYQMALAEMLTLEAERQHLGSLPIYEYNVGGDQKKSMRIAGLEPYFRKGLIYYHSSQQEFYEEYLQFSSDIGNRLVDTLDALAMQRESWEQLRFLGDPDEKGGREEWQDRARKKQDQIRKYHNRRTREWKPSR